MPFDPFQVHSTKSKLILIQLTHDSDNAVRAVAEQALQRLSEDKLDK